MNDVITFPDRNLEAAIRRQLRKPKGDLLLSDFEGIRTLYLDGDQIVDPSGLAALTGPKEPVKMMVKEFEERRDLIMKLIKEIPSLHCDKPKGAFYIFPRFDQKMPSEELALLLMDKAEVALTGGSSFGSAGEQHLRISYATNKKNIQEGMGRLKRTLEKI